MKPNSRSLNSALITENDYSQSLHDKLCKYTLKHVDDNKPLLSRLEFINYVNEFHDRRIVLWDIIESNKIWKSPAYLLYFANWTPDSKVPVTKRTNSIFSKKHTQL